MDKLVIRPRRRPAVIAVCALGIITCSAGWLYRQAKEDSAASLAGVLVCVSAAMLVSVAAGALRTRIIMDEEGISSINSAFAPERKYKWKDLKYCKKAGVNYNLYTKDNQWIGAVDQRNVRFREFLEALRHKKIIIIDHPADAQ